MPFFSQESVLTFKMQYTVGTTFVVLICATITTVLLEDSRMFEGITWSVCTRNNCIFGWMSPFWRWKMLIFGLWVGAVCITGFNYAVSSFREPTIILLMLQ